MITLALAKSQLRVTTNDEDALIQFYIDSAYSHINEWCDRAFSEYPASLDHAALLLVAGADIFRSDVTLGAPVQANPALDRLMRPHLKMGFGAVDFAIPSLENDDAGLFVGVTWLRDWQWLQSDGTPTNLTGFTAVLDFDGTEYPATISNASEGRVSFTFTDEVTATFAPKRTLYALKVTSPGGEVTLLDRKAIAIT